MEKHERECICPNCFKSSPFQPRASLSDHRTCPHCFYLFYEYGRKNELVCPYCGDPKEGRFPSIGVVCKKCKKRFFATSSGKAYKFSSPVMLSISTAIVVIVTFAFLFLIVQGAMQFYSGTSAERSQVAFKAIVTGLLVWGFLRIKPLMV